MQFFCLLAVDIGWLSKMLASNANIVEQLFLVIYSMSHIVIYDMYVCVYHLVGGNWQQGSDITLVVVIWGLNGSGVVNWVAALYLICFV